MIQGLNGISASVIADSIDEERFIEKYNFKTVPTRITTLQLRFHRFILPEFNTHRMFSRNASSSRAIPVKKLIDQVRNDPALPVHWGANQPGMQAEKENSALIRYEGGAFQSEFTASEFWEDICSLQCSDLAETMSDAGYHKQIVNRLTEAFQYVNVIVTATEWDNFFKLRLHKDAQPEIRELARVMKQAMDESTPEQLQLGDWHLPYVSKEEYQDLKNLGLSKHKIRMVSSARCARVSYLNHDQSEPVLAKDLDLSEMLLQAGHMSPFEHQATPINTVNATIFDKGITHMSRGNDVEPTFLWSANFKGWKQFRHMI